MPGLAGITASHQPSLGKGGVGFDSEPVVFGLLFCFPVLLSSSFFSFSLPFTRLFF
jgi:hypothetical protein